MFVGTLFKLKDSMKKMDEAYCRRNWEECYQAAKEADRLLDKYVKELPAAAISADGYYKWNDNISRKMEESRIRIGRG